PRGSPRDRTLGLICFALRCAVYYYSSTSIRRALFEQLGAGFFPKLAAAALAVLGLLLFISNFRVAGTEQRPSGQPNVRDRLAIWIVLGLLVVYTVMLPVVGFRVASGVFVPLSIWILGRFRYRALLVGLVVGLITTFG